MVIVYFQLQFLFILTVLFWSKMFNFFIISLYLLLSFFNFETIKKSHFDNFWTKICHFFLSYLIRLSEKGFVYSQLNESYIHQYENWCMQSRSYFAYFLGLECKVGSRLTYFNQTWMRI